MEKGEKGSAMIKGRKKGKENDEVRLFRRKK